MHTGGGAVPDEYNIVVLVDLVHVSELAIGGVVQLRLNLQLLDDIVIPALGESIAHNTLNGSSS